MCAGIRLGSISIGLHCIVSRIPSHSMQDNSHDIKAQRKITGFVEIGDDESSLLLFLHCITSTCYFQRCNSTHTHTHAEWEKHTLYHYLSLTLAACQLEHYVLKVNSCTNLAQVKIVEPTKNLFEALARQEWEISISGRLKWFTRVFFGGGMFEMFGRSI